MVDFIQPYCIFYEQGRRTMKHMIVLMVIGALLLAPLTTLAQQTPEPGSGGVIVVGSPGGTLNLTSLDPLRVNDSLGYSITSLMFPTVLGVSPFTQYYGKVGDEGVYNGLATNWTISEDSRVYTFTLRRDAVWSDGVPITATDVKFSFDAMASFPIEEPLYAAYNYDPDYNPSGVKEIVVVDDYTFQAVFNQANCDGLIYAGGFTVVPAHAFGYDGSPDFDFSVIIGHEFDTNPTVVYGPFQMDYLRYGEEIALKAVPTWADGTVIPAGIIFRDAIDLEDETARFLAGEFDYIESPSYSYIASIRAAPDVTVVSLPGNSWDYLALNVADPTNPQNGLDADGNPIDQGHHPIFGDVRVRRAMQLAIDVPSLIQAAAFGEGTQMASSLLPTSWAADPDLAPVPYDPALAAQMLDEAGWPVGPNGTRVCRGCKYALDGTPFAFQLVTNEGNTRREAMGEIIKDQLGELGIEVDFQTYEFSKMGAKGQTYDAYIMGWINGFPDDPDQIGILGGPYDDFVENSLNASSYANPEFVRLSRKALTLPGCDPTARAAIYHQIEKLLQDDQPYVWLFAQNRLYAAHNYVVGFDPYPNMPLWNIHTWQVQRP
jgi:peptide/nickel transport system substrate-binding protein